MRAVNGRIKVIELHRCWCQSPVLHTSARCRDASLATREQQWENYTALAKHQQLCLCDCVACITGSLQLHRFSANDPTQRSCQCSSLCPYTRDAGLCWSHGHGRVGGLDSRAYRARGERTSVSCAKLEQASLPVGLSGVLEHAWTSTACVSTPSKLHPLRQCQWFTRRQLSPPGQPVALPERAQLACALLGRVDWDCCMPLVNPFALL